MNREEKPSHDLKFNEKHSHRFVPAAGGRAKGN